MVAGWKASSHGRLDQPSLARKVPALQRVVSAQLHSPPFYVYPLRNFKGRHAFTSINDNTLNSDRVLASSLFRYEVRKIQRAHPFCKHEYKVSEGSILLSILWMTGNMEPKMIKSINTIAWNRIPERPDCAHGVENTNFRI
jgi:hypothetical protein